MKLKKALTDNVPILGHTGHQIFKLQLLLQLLVDSWAADFFCTAKMFLHAYSVIVLFMLMNVNLKSKEFQRIHKPCVPLHRDTSGRFKNFERGFQVDKNTQPNLSWKPKKQEVITSSFSRFSQTATSLASSKTPKPTHCPWLKVILALHTTNRG